MLLVFRIRGIVPGIPNDLQKLHPSSLSLPSTNKEPWRRILERAVHFQRLPPELEAIDRGDRLLGLRGRLEGQEAEARGP